MCAALSRGPAIFGGPPVGCALGSVALRYKGVAHSQGRVQHNPGGAPQEVEQDMRAAIGIDPVDLDDEVSKGAGDDADGIAFGKVILKGAQDAAPSGTPCGPAMASRGS